MHGKEHYLLFPKDQQTRYNLAIVYNELHHPQKALKELKTIISQNPRTVIAQLAKSMMGGTYFTLGYKNAAHKAASSIYYAILKKGKKNLPEMNINLSLK